MVLRTLTRPALAVLALGFGLSLGTAAADPVPQTISTMGDPSHAALLNAGTALTGLTTNRSVGLGVETISGAGAEAAGVEVGGVEVAGVTAGADAAGATVQTESTTGAPSLAALLNTATAASAIGPTGRVAAGVTAFPG